jgi:outer membrane receptor protein involved in Fe transport
MQRSSRAIRRLLASALFALASIPPAFAAGTDADTVSMAHDPGRYGIVVSATKTARNPLDVPNGTVVVSGRELRRTGARTLADALIDVAGVEAGGGSDNGTRFTNIGMWGLKEFDALLVTVDGVPVGGPFNPSLAQIAVDDIERIEIVKGPQGTLYGVSAFAGMVQVFTDRSTAGRGSLTLGGGDFTNFHGTARGHHDLNGWTMDGSLSGLHDDGWQEETTSETYRARASLSHALGSGTLGGDVSYLHDRADFGSPLPVDGGVPVAGFDRDRNYGIRDGEMKHDIFGLNAHGRWPVNAHVRLENTLGFSYDSQKALRSFFLDPGAIVGDTAIDAEGISLEPDETTLFEDLRAVTRFEAGGRHELVTGASLTWGHTKASGHGFDFAQDLLDPSTIPSSTDIPPGDNRAFDDTRTYFGFYAHHEWTPVKYFTLSGGGRFDQANEDLDASFEELSVPSPLLRSHDSQNVNDWSGDIAAMVRLLPGGARGIEALNLYGNWKSSFKPAAPNLTEAEDAEILDPEHTHSVEGGLKARVLDGQLALDVSGFQMDFENLVVAILDPSNNPVLVNAGRERFKGWDVSLTAAPRQLPGLSLSGGYGWHDPRFVQFTFFTPDGTFRDVSGKLIELAPRLLWNLRAAYSPGGRDAKHPYWPGAWVAVRHQGERALNRRNRFFTGPYTEWDAGLSLELSRVSVNVTGRNLGDDRHFVGESEIGDSQFYVSPPRRITAEVTLAF